jgi:hypothetical protein
MIVAIAGELPTGVIAKFPSIPDVAFTRLQAEMPEFGGAEHQVTHRREGGLWVLGAC